MKFIILLYITLILVLHLIPLGEGGTNRFDLGPLRADYFLHTLVFTPWMFLVYLARPRIEDSGNKKKQQQEQPAEMANLQMDKIKKSFKPQRLSGLGIYWNRSGHWSGKRTVLGELQGF